MEDQKSSRVALSWVRGYGIGQGTLPWFWMTLLQTSPLLWTSCVTLCELLILSGIHFTFLEMERPNHHLQVFFFPMKWENLNEELSIKRCLTNTGFWISQETETLLNVLFKLSSCKRWDMRTSRWDCGLLVQQRFTDFGWVLAGWETWADGKKGRSQCLTCLADT